MTDARFETPTGNIEQSRLVLGPMWFPVLGEDGQLKLQERSFSFKKTREVIEALRILGVDIDFRHYIRTDYTGTDEVDEEAPTGLFSTRTGGRSEALTIAPEGSPLNLFPEAIPKPRKKSAREVAREVVRQASKEAIGKASEQPSLEEAREAAKEVLLQLIREETGLSLPAGVLIKLKGRGPKGDKIPQRQSLLSQEYYQQQHSLQGFTSVDEHDALLPFLIEQEQDVVGMDGHGESYQYRPSRILLAVIPIQSIRDRQTRAILAQPQDWNEPLYLELFVEAGGYCLEDLMTAQEQGADLVSYAEAVLATYGFTKSDDPTLTQEARRKQISAFLIQKAWYDAQVEARYFTIGANRSMQNKTLGGDQDFDDCKRKEPPTVDVSFLEYFFQKIDRLKHAGFITQETLVASLHTVMDNLTTITSTINDQSSVPHSDKEVRRNRDHYSGFFSSIARACGEIPREEAIQLLNRIITQEDLGNDRSGVFSSIAEACGRIGQEEEYKQRAIDILTSIMTQGNLGHDRSWVLESIAEACGRIGGEEAAQFLKEIMDQDNLGGNRSLVFSSIAKACGEIGKEEQYKQKAMNILNTIMTQGNLGDNRSGVFSSIAEACGAIGGEKAAQLLEEIMKQQNLWDHPSLVFSSIAEACGEIGKEEQYKQKAMNILNTIMTQGNLGDHPSLVFSSIAEACGEIGKEEGIELLKTIMGKQNLWDNPSLVFSSIAEACGAIGGEKAAQFLEKIMDQDNLGGNRSLVFSSIAEACGEIGKEEQYKQKAMNILNTIMTQGNLGDHPSWVFSSIAEACGAIGGEKAIELLEKIMKQDNLGDNRSRVLESIARAFGAIGKKEQEPS